MFEPPAEAWPVEVRLDLWAHMTAEFVHGLKRRPIEGVTVTVEMLRYTPTSSNTTMCIEGAHDRLRQSSVGSVLSTSVARS